MNKAIEKVLKDKDLRDTLFEQNIIKATDAYENTFDKDKYIENLDSILRGVGEQIKEAAEKGEFSTVLNFNGKIEEMDHTIYFIQQGLENFGYKLDTRIIEGRRKDKHYYEITVSWGPVRPVSPVPTEISEDKEKIYRKRTDKEIADAWERYQHTLDYKKKFIKAYINNSKAKDDLYKALCDTKCKGYELTKDLVDILTKPFEK